MTRTTPPSTPHPAAPAGDDGDDIAALFRDYEMGIDCAIEDGSIDEEDRVSALGLLADAEKQLASLRAENARLREELATVLAERDGICAVAKAANAEVERLRGLLVGLDDRADELMQTNSAYAAWVLAYNEALAALAPPGSESQKKGDGER